MLYAQIMKNIPLSLAAMTLMATLLLTTFPLAANDAPAWSWELDDFQYDDLPFYQARTDLGAESNELSLIFSPAIHGCELPVIFMQVPINGLPLQAAQSFFSSEQREHEINVLIALTNANGEPSIIHNQIARILFDDDSGLPLARITIHPGEQSEQSMMPNNDDPESGDDAALLMEAEVALSFTMMSIFLFPAANEQVLPQVIITPEHELPLPVQPSFSLDLRATPDSQRSIYTTITNCKEGS